MHRSIALAVSASALLASVASAHITGVAGAVHLINAPADARLNVLTSGDFARVWDENQNVTLTSGIIVDARTPGLYDQESDLTTLEIGRGVAVASHYIHFDSPGDSAAAITGAVHFSSTILGVIVRGDNADNLLGHLDRSDYLGAPTLYSDNVVHRGIEFENDWFRIGADGKGIEFHLQIASPGDYIRVVTDVPAPGASSLAGLASLVAFAHRRRD